MAHDIIVGKIVSLDWQVEEHVEHVKAVIIETGYGEMKKLFRVNRIVEVDTGEALEDGEGNKIVYSLSGDCLWLAPDMVHFTKNKAEDFDLNI